MLSLVRPLLHPLLRRNPAQIERKARRFHIERDGGRELVRGVGEAFFGGYNAMLEVPSLAEIARLGSAVSPHYRPFFHEGAAMGYLPRGYLRGDAGRPGLERDLLGIDPAFRYLYYVGVGFWYAVRHPRHPNRIEGLVPHVDPMYFPLCYDGLGFKLGFFHQAAGRALRKLRRCPDERAAWVHQGFGRSLFFVYMDDERAFDGVLAQLPAARRADVRFGQALATGFTGVDKPASLLAYVAGAPDDDDFATRLTGLTWALTARRMCDPEYFAGCMGRASDAMHALLSGLPDICDRELGHSSSYGEWQRRTREAVLAAYADELPRVVDAGG